RIACFAQFLRSYVFFRSRRALAVDAPPKAETGRSEITSLDSRIASSASESRIVVRSACAVQERHGRADPRDGRVRRGRLGRKGEEMSPRSGLSCAVAASILALAAAASGAIEKVDSTPAAARSPPAGKPIVIGAAVGR